MKIIGFELEEWEKNVFTKLSETNDLLLTDLPVKPHLDGKYLDAEIISTFIYSDLSADSLKQFKRLKLIATRSTGFDHIDFEYCNRNGITICNVPTYADETVAEHVFALLLAISRKITEAVRRTKTGDFSQKGLQGFDLRGKTIGVIGTGNIGKHVIKIARGFEMNVIAYDVKLDEQMASSLGFKYVELDQLLSSADIITLHVPGTEKTRHMISRAELSTMKKGSVLLNTSRGDVIDTWALLEALTDGKLAAVGLDVLSEEPVIREETELLHSIISDQYDLKVLFSGHMMTHQPNALITPHNAFNTREAVERLLETSVENIRSFIKGKPQNVVG